MPEVLDRFVVDALRAGEERSSIGRVLTEAGWAERDIQRALAAFSPVDFAVPVPTPKAGVVPRDAFLYLLLFGALYSSAFHLGNVFFQLVNLAYPDPSWADPEFLYTSLRWSISTLVVAIPLFFSTAWRETKTAVVRPERRASAMRMWLLYFTLLLATAVLIGDLIALIYNVISGGDTVAFYLKALIVAVIAGGVLLYCQRTARGSDEPNQYTASPEGDA